MVLAVMYSAESSLIRAEPKTVMAGPTKCSRRIPRNISVAIRCKIAKLRSLLRGLAKNSVSSESSLSWRGVGLGTVSTYGHGVNLRARCQPTATVSTYGDG
ncbi:MAG: hypothetical protein RIR87_1642, partial [Actinomycetota bacterium]